MPNSSERTAQRKRLFSVVLFIGISALTIGGLSLFNGLSTPFPKNSNGNGNTTNGSDLDSVIATLKGRDTDGDGLSDYEELYVYHTSPFLKDTDGDGVPDGTEIKNDTDPNCPNGNTCGVVTSNSNGNSNVNGNTNSSSSEAAALRQALINSGASATVINSLSDQAIISQYSSAVKGSSGIATNGSLVNADLQNLSATQLRSLLESNGIDKTTLDTIDDNTLMTVYYNALGSDTNSNTNQ